MEFIHLALGHGADLLVQLAIVGSLIFAGLELWHVQKAQQVRNGFEIAKHHREIWLEYIDRPELTRILESNPDITSHPVTNIEALFVTFLILHLHASFQARKHKMHVSFDALHKDIKWFFYVGFIDTEMRE